MGTEFKRADCATFRRPTESDVLRNGSRTAAARRRAGSVLRHWTTNGSVFMGKATTTTTDAADWGLADSRQLNVLASRLKSLSTGVGAL